MAGILGALGPIGLALDLVGVVILTFDAADTFKKTLEAFNDVGKRSGGINMRVVEEAKKAGWRNTWLGLGFILAGLLCQFLSSLDTVFNG